MADLFSSHRFSSKINQLRFSPDGTLLAVGCDDGKIILWDLNNGECKAKRMGHSKYINSMAYSYNGEILASGNPNGVILWNGRTGDFYEYISSDHVLSLAFSPVGLTLAYGCSTNSFVLRNIRDKSVERVEVSGSVWGLSFSPNGFTLASGCSDSIILWDLKNQCKSIMVYPGFSRSLAFSPDGNTLASAGRHSIILRKRQNGDYKSTVNYEYSDINELKFLSDDILAGASFDKSIVLWSNGIKFTLKEHSDSVNTLSFSPSGELLASGGDDCTLKLWRINRLWYKRMSLVVLFELLRRKEATLAASNKNNKEDYEIAKLVLILSDLPKDIWQSVLIFV